MGLLILHAERLRPRRLSHVKSMIMCFLRAALWLLYDVQRLLKRAAGERGLWGGNLTNELHYWGAYQRDPLERVMYYPVSRKHATPSPQHANIGAYTSSMPNGYINFEKRERWMKNTKDGGRNKEFRENKKHLQEIISEQKSLLKK